MVIVTSRNPDAQAHVHQCLARAATCLGRVEEARSHMERAVELFADAGEITACAESHRQLSWVAEQQGDLKAALFHAQRSLAGHRAANTPGPRTVAALTAVSWCHILLGRHRQALAHCQEALAGPELHDRPYLAADVWDSTGLAQHHLGRHSDAAASYERALALYRRAGVVQAEADTLRRLGDTHLTSGQVEQARSAWTQALALLEPLGHADSEAVRTQLEALTTNPPCR
ncbi:tetratricopeptide repeat protein [Streptomyces coerulescens]|uniref:Tetratricopeptide repeat protein n=1 Tax=Streptomyces coerulescens TaxID=29304 RepID=A0ABW0CBW2_STRCD